jgi:hypothetical protein
VLVGVLFTLGSARRWAAVASGIYRSPSLATGTASRSAFVLRLSWPSESDAGNALTKRVLSRQKIPAMRGHALRSSVDKL